MQLIKALSRLFLTVSANICLLYIWFGLKILDSWLMIVILAVMCVVAAGLINKSSGWFHGVILICLAIFAVQTLSVFYLWLGVKLDEVTYYSAATVLLMTVLSANPRTTLSQ